MKEDDYPALFLCADDASNSYQRLFLFLIRAEYFSLFSAAVLSMSFFNGAGFYAAYALVFFVALITLLTRALRKPEQDWYRCRALAESVKTLTWRYVMHAAPFQGNDQDPLAKAELRNQLHLVFDSNRATAEKIVSDWTGNDQITKGMEQIRGLSARDRLAYYLERRIDDQRNWYAKKATFNKRSATYWVSISVLLYLFAGGMALARVALPDWQYWPIEPLIVLAASIVGWVQIKKFNELAAAYTVTAHEIGIIKSRIDDSTTSQNFSEFVNDAEKAFSREHTLWIARQSD